MTVLKFTASTNHYLKLINLLKINQLAYFHQAYNTALVTCGLTFARLQIFLEIILVRNAESYSRAKNFGLQIASH